MSMLGNGLSQAGQIESALHTQQALESLLLRGGESGRNIIAVKGNIAGAYRDLGRHEQALVVMREIYEGMLALEGVPLSDADRRMTSNNPSADTLQAAVMLASCLMDNGKFGEVISLAREQAPKAERALGRDHRWSLDLIELKGWAHWKRAADTGCLDDAFEAEAILEDVYRRARRVCGDAHPTVKLIRDRLAHVKKAVALARAAPFEASA